MSNNNEWTDFEKGLDGKYLSVNRAFQKKKKWIIGFIFCTFIGILIFLNRGINSTYERVKERTMITHFETWVKSGKPLGEELAQLVKSRNWEQYHTITNATFIHEKHIYETLFVTFWP